MHWEWLLQSPCDKWNPRWFHKWWIYDGKIISVICFLSLGFFPSKNIWGWLYKKKKKQEAYLQCLQSKKEMLWFCKWRMFLQCFRLGRTSGVDVIKGFRSKQINSAISSLTLLPYGNLFLFSFILCIIDLGETKSIKNYFVNSFLSNFWIA